MNMNFMLRTACVWAALAVAAGCGAKTPATSSVTGVVTFNGTPLEGAQVTFFGEGRPAAGPRPRLGHHHPVLPRHRAATRPKGHPRHAALGIADAQGRFQLMTFGPGDGALPGEYVVVITKTEAGSTDPNNPYAPVRSLIPERYGDRAKSGLTATVQLGKSNEFTFELTN